MAANEARFNLKGDSSDAEKAFARVGNASKEMASDVDRSSKRLASSAGDSSRDIAGAVDASEGKFRGLGDAIGGTGDVMEGFRTGNVAQMAMGFADLAGAASALVIPAIQGMRTALATGLAPALTMISAHPLIAGLIGGAAIIAGLILLEKKFGLVSKAVEALGNVFTNIWPGIKGVLNLIIGGLEAIGNAALDVITAPIGLLNKIPGVKSIVPNVPDIHLPRFHTGGVAGRDTLAVLQQGETVTPRGQQSGGTVELHFHGVGMGRDFAYAVAQALRDNKLIGVTV